MFMKSVHAAVVHLFSLLYNGATTPHFVYPLYCRCRFMTNATMNILVLVVLWIYAHTDAECIPGSVTVNVQA